MLLNGVNSDMPSPSAVLLRDGQHHEHMKAIPHPFALLQKCLTENNYSRKSYAVNTYWFLDKMNRLHFHAFYKNDVFLFGLVLIFKNSKLLDNLVFFDKFKLRSNLTNW